MRRKEPKLTDEVLKENIRNLANAVVKQAADDYRLALHGREQKFTENTAGFDRGELEEFFRSSWFQALCDLDGEELMKQLKEDEGI